MLWLVLKKAISDGEDGGYGEDDHNPDDDDGNDCGYYENDIGPDIY